MPRKLRNHEADKPSGPKDAAEKMADAISYLCRVAAQEGFLAVLPDLLQAKQKLEHIARSEDDPPSQSIN